MYSYHNRSKHQEKDKIIYSTITTDYLLQYAGLKNLNFQTNQRLQ